MLFDFRSGNINEGSTHIIHQSALPLKSPAPNSLEEQKSRLETSRSRLRMRGASAPSMESMEESTVPRAKRKTALQ